MHLTKRNKRRKTFVRGQVKHIYTWTHWENLKGVVCHHSWVRWWWGSGQKSNYCCSSSKESSKQKSFCDLSSRSTKPISVFIFFRRIGFVTKSFTQMRFFGSSVFVQNLWLQVQIAAKFAGFSHAKSGIRTLQNSRFFCGIFTGNTR